MRGKLISMAAALSMAGVLASGAFAQEGAMASEIAPSVTFGPSAQPRFSLADFRGKLVVVVFFQSWCPICNRWSPRLISQIEQAAGDKREVVLLAVKTDGGGWKGAASYLEKKVADPSRWLIASDPEAAWYQVAAGTDELWGYLIIGPDGKVVSSGKAGMFYTSGADKDRFSLAVDLDQYIAKTRPTTILPKDKTYHPSLKNAVLAAELRQFAIAWPLCGKASGKEASASAAELKKDLSDWASERVKALVAVTADEQATGEAKFDAAVELKQIADGLGATDAGKEARKAASAAAKDKAVVREMQAQADYLALMSKAVAAKKLVKNPEFAAALNVLAQKHPDTRYGRMAADAAARIAG